MIMKTISVNTRIAISYANRASHCEYDRKWMETETRTWPEFTNGGKAIVEQILASEEINKSKKKGLSELQSK